MVGVNKYFRHSKISEARFRHLVRCFVLDLTATPTAAVTGISVRSTNAIFLRMRRRMPKPVSAVRLSWARSRPTNRTSALVACVASEVAEPAARPSCSGCCSEAMRSIPRSPGANVIAKNQATGQTLNTVSTSAGDYRFPSLPIGTYEITASAQGFKAVRQVGVVVQIQSTTSLDIKLNVGASSETVEVMANALQLQTESSDVGTVVTPREVLDLPLSTNGSAIRNSQDFVFLTPATYGTGTGGGTFEGGVSGGQAFGSEIIFDGEAFR